MKDFFVYRTVWRLSLPFIVAICMLTAGAVPARAAARGQVVVGFVGSPPPGFQNVLLNVQAVRINPKKNVSPTGGGWQRIPTPPGIGGQNQNAELQIDLNASQNIPQLFNTAGVKVNTYRTAEILLDPNNPGVLIPNCPQSPPRLEGCINYPIALTGGNVISVSDSSGGGLVTTGKAQLGVLMLNLQVMVNQAPTSPGGAYQVTINLNTVPLNSVQALVTGAVTVNGSGTAGSSGKVRALRVTAQAIGTNTAIASSKVKTGKGCPAPAPGCYTLALPAAGGLNGTVNGFGTLYDLAVAGGGNTYAAQRLLPLYPGQSLPTSINFTVKGPQMLGNITGKVTDMCNGNPVVGATLQLLIPPDPPNPNSAADCTTNPEQCVAVATANTNNTGGFPLPGTLLTPPEFENVPVVSNSNSYAMQITAPGYDNLVVLAKPSSQGKNSGGSCSTDGGTKFSKCNLVMNRGTITGTIPITPPLPGQTTLVQVFAEDTGTNNIVGALPMPVSIKAPTDSVSFTLNVPTATVPMPAFRTFDLFATTIDLYQGFTDPYQGHTVAVLSGVQIPNAATSTCSTATATFVQSIDCIGHGSITGGVANVNLGTSVVLSKQDLQSHQDVQLTSSIVQNQAPLPNPSNNYSFCIPADTYDVQRFQLPLPDPDVTPLAMPTPEPDGAPIMATIPPAPVVNGPGPTPTVTPTGGPTPTATPSSAPTPKIKCPTTCSNQDGSCPGVCNNVIVPIPSLP